MDARLVNAPPALRARMLDALAATPGPAHEGAPDLPLIQRLRSAADRLLAESSEGPPEHETAVTLLAADGLATLACEILAQVDPGALARLD